MEPINSITERIARDFIPPEIPVKPSGEPENRFGLGDPNCPICGGLGFVIVGGNEDDLTSGTQVPCSCRKKRFADSGKKAKITNANLSGYEQMTFENFKVEGRGQLREEQKTNLTLVRPFLFTGSGESLPLSFEYEAGPRLNSREYRMPYPE